MEFATTAIAGVILVTSRRAADVRGSFARLFDDEALRKAGLPHRFSQVSQSRNLKRGTLRGMHFQTSPHDEEKLVWCTHGSVFDVVVDLRANSPTRHRWLGVDLGGATDRGIFVPQGCAHGFLTTSDDAELVYFITTPYVADAARGVRWDDPALGIVWPFPPSVISERDAGFGDVGA